MQQHPLPNPLHPVGAIRAHPRASLGLARRNQPNLEVQKPNGRPNRGASRLPLSMRRESELRAGATAFRPKRQSRLLP